MKRTYLAQRLMDQYEAARAQNTDRTTRLHGEVLDLRDAIEADRFDAVALAHMMSDLRYIATN